MKRYTEKAAASVVNAVLRAARKMPRKSMHEPWKDEQGRTCATDGFRAYCLNAAPDGLKITLSARPDPAAFKAGAEENNKMLARIFAPLDNGNTVEMPAPNPDAVKSFMADDKEQGGRGVYDLGEDFPAVNAKYLWDMLRLFPVAKWFVHADMRFRMTSPIYIIAEEGRACLMPVREDYKLRKASEAQKAPAAAPEERPETIPAADPAPAADETTAEKPAPATDGKAARGPVPEKTFIGQTITGNGWKILFDGTTSRTRIIFDESPTDAARAAVDKAGFFYSAAMNSFNKKLTFKAYRAAQVLASELTALYPAA